MWNPGRSNSMQPLLLARRTREKQCRRDGETAGAETHGSGCGHCRPARLVLSRSILVGIPPKRAEAALVGHSLATAGPMPG